MELKNKDCYDCIEELEQGLSVEEVNKNHKSCDEWFHCGDECCGACSHCNS